MNRKRIHATYLLFILLIAGILTLYSCQQDKGYHKTDRGIIVTVHNKDSKTQKLRLQVIAPSIIRVTASPDEDFSRPKSLMRKEEELPSVSWQVHQNHDSLVLQTKALKALVDLKSGQIQFLDTAGQVVLAEEKQGRIFHSDTVDGEPAYHIRQLWENDVQTAVYGLGGNQLGLTNLQGKDVALIQRNSEAYVPFFLSPGKRNTNEAYGILWDNNSITHFGDPSPYLPLDSLQLYNEKGEPGGLTATYLPGGASKLLGQSNQITHTDLDLKREENNIDYRFLEDQKRFPKVISQDPSTSVEWEGDIASPYSGTHTFKIYWGGYVKIWINNQRVFPKTEFPSSNPKRQGWAWRQPWNPAEKLLSIPMEKGKKYHLKIQWLPGGESFISFKWKKPKSRKQLHQTSLASEVGQDIDYYFISGQNMDSIISGYRDLTGKAPMMPKWAYGYWQSREHYESQKQILQVVQKFRKKKFPIDNIVQDWFYWKEDKWGSQKFDSSRYPDPEGMIDTLHQKYHTHFMISVWPKFYVDTKPFKKFWDKGWLYKKSVEDSVKDWVGQGYVSTFYDAFNKDARKAFWNLVDTNLFKLGVDAWWLDATEPDILSNTSVPERKELMKPNALGSPSKNFNAYSLEQSKVFYKGQREEKPNQRVFILTRSVFAGSQRFAAANWSGDIGATWWDMRNQIATGISLSMSGIPYWTMDIGGFAAEHRYQYADESSRAEWQEQFTRWFQFGAFCPLFRAHGQLPVREPFNVAPKGSPAYQSMLYYDKLRYRMLPYIYSLAGAVYNDSYTLMRGLAMDFPKDTLAGNITDEYMFGPDLLINPVYKYKARSRKVYLPSNMSTSAGKNRETIWYNLYTGESFTGNQTISADAPYKRMPIFVKSGAILPFGPALQYTSQKKADTITLYVYTGEDGHFDLYEDDGLSYDYEQGESATIPINYHESGETLTIGEREGHFKGMLKERTFKIRKVSPDHAESLNLNRDSEKLIQYKGKEITVKL